MKGIFGKLALFLVVLIWASGAFASDVNLSPSIIKAIESRVVVAVGVPVWSGAPSASYHLASGFVVAPGYVVTCSHVFTNIIPVIASEKISIMVAKSLNDDPTKARIAAVDLANDLVLLQIDEPEKVGPPVKLADAFPKDGETVYVSGLWGGQLNATLKAVVLGTMTNLAYDSYRVPQVGIIDRAIPPGFSGGPVFNTEGKLVGLNLFTAEVGGLGGILTLPPIKNIMKEIK